MKKNVIILLYLLISGILSWQSNFSIAGENWYSGGSLHRSTILQWKNATPSNRLATAADWALTKPSIKNKVVKSGSMNTLKPYAISIVQCINEAAQGNELNKMSTTELAATCILMMEW